MKQHGNQGKSGIRCQNHQENLGQVRPKLGTRNCGIGGWATGVSGCTPDATSSNLKQHAMFQELPRHQSSMRVEVFRVRVRYMVSTSLGFRIIIQRLPAIFCANLRGQTMTT